jgi:hypothetical protein
MISILLDHDIEGLGTLLWSVATRDEWQAFDVEQFLTFQEAGLAFTASDREIYRFAQAHFMLLLTANRNMRGPDSLEKTLREEHHAFSLPIITIANKDRVRIDPLHRYRCATRIQEIAWLIETQRGIQRIFI